MRRISVFIFSLFFCAGAFAQKDTVSVRKDTAAPKFTRHGLRVGADLYKLTRGLYDDKYQGLELVGDYRLTRRYFLAAELGSEKKTDDKDRLDFTTKGTYFKVGFDYNFYDNWLDMDNVITIGLRYGVASFSQTLNSYKIYNPNPYFGEEIVVVTGQEFKGLSASWAEVVLGLKAEMFSNIYVGFSARLNYMISEKEPNNFANLYIPGFNRTYDGKIGVGFNYTVSYLIPIYKSQVKVVEKEAKKKAKKKK
ncbi:MAG: hypothetical protein EOO50_04845 [Flavobacterium sp.]|uniref:DUF6048 family protein n=1 Tax=Flavobacterium sp. TaxID=239 RepID=UPI00120054BF|nr:DUF6048 family protein [Flavobacterium sp.]RZJ67610.1 MAG: hypothetical protein EOO50_04845 [Flavobacterium sp.]